MHASFIVIKPPGGTLLDLADGIGILETAQDTADRFIVIGIQAVNNGFRKLDAILSAFRKSAIWLEGA